MHGSKEDDEVVVETKNGRVRGLTLKAATGKKVSAWYGIPYAKKPIGERLKCYEMSTLRIDRNLMGFCFANR